MEINTKQYLRENPCYLVAVLILASEGSPELLEKAYGNEKTAFDALQIAKIHEGHMKIYPPSDFPISISRKNECIKIPERLAGLILAEKKNFVVMPCDLAPQKLYAAAWLEQFSKTEQAEIKAKYDELVQELPHTHAPDSGKGKVAATKLLP